MLCTGQDRRPRGTRAAPQGRALLQNGQAETQQLNLYVWGHLTLAVSCSLHVGRDWGTRWALQGRDTCHLAGAVRAEVSPVRQLLLSFPQAHI